jgi:hypothetical protein
MQLSDGLLLMISLVHSIYLLLTVYVLFVIVY